MKHLVKICCALSLTALVVFSACKTDNEKPSDKPIPTTVIETIKRPAFDADSAYTFVKQQVDFGPRVPGSAAHAKAADWLEAKMRTYSPNVFRQTASGTMYNGTKVPIYNIITAFNPNKTDRILLGAHWDSRHIADKDDDESVKNNPIDGANDGASGVGVLMEIARQLSEMNTDKGIDIIFFDTEDLGAPAGVSSREENNYCIGSQYWAQNPHVPNYQAKYGILLDMVGAPDAKFNWEIYSMNEAPGLSNKVWDNAIQLGYNYLFIKNPGIAVIDDHYYVMRYRGFKMIDIIDNDKSRESEQGHGFGHFHHTQEDTIEGIDPNTLRAVGETVLSVILE